MRRLAQRAVDDAFVDKEILAAALSSWFGNWLNSAAVRAAQNHIPTRTLNACNADCIGSIERDTLHP